MNNQTDYVLDFVSRYTMPDNDRFMFPDSYYRDLFEKVCFMHLNY